MRHLNKKIGLVALIAALLPTASVLAQTTIVPIQSPGQIMPNPNLAPANAATPPRSYPTPSNSQITDSVTQAQRDTTREHIKTQTPSGPATTNK